MGRCTSDIAIGARRLATARGVRLLSFLLRAGSAAVLLSLAAPACNSAVPSSGRPGVAPRSHHASSDTTRARPWKTYRSAAHGYSIDHPSAARVETSGASTKFRFTESFDRDGAEVHDDLTFDVRVLDNPKGLSARSWLDSRVVQDRDAVRAEGVLESDGVQGYEATVSDVDESVRHVVVVENGHAFELSYVEPDSSSLAFPRALASEYGRVFQKMLASFHSERKTLGSRP